MTTHRAFWIGIGAGVAFFALFLIITFITIRSHIFNLSFLIWDTRIEEKSVEKVLRTVSEAGLFPKSIRPDLKLYVMAICSYYGKSSFTHNQTVIPQDKIKALNSLRLLIKTYPRSFVINRAVLSQLVYADVLMMLERNPILLSELKCDKETLEMEYESQLAILNACGLFLGSSADISFIDGDYGSAFHYFRRQGFSEGAIYCYEYGIGTPPLPSMWIWVLKGVGWLLGDFDSYDYWLLQSEYNGILERRAERCGKDSQ